MKGKLRADVGTVTRWSHTVINTASDTRTPRVSAVFELLAVRKPFLIRWANRLPRAADEVLSWL